MDYIVVFDVATKSRPWIMFAPFFLIFLTSLHALWRKRKGERAWMFNRHQPRHVALIAVFSAVLLSIQFYSYESQRRDMIDALAQGRVATVEGVASGNPDSRTFYVGDTQFCPSGGPRQLSPAYQGPPLRLPPNSWVRVSHMQGHVLRVEVAR